RLRRRLFGWRLGGGAAEREPALPEGGDPGLDRRLIEALATQVGAQAGFDLWPAGRAERAGLERVHGGGDTLRPRALASDVRRGHTHGLAFASGHDPDPRPLRPH